MTGKRILLAGIPVLAFAALIGGGFATWYFTTSDQVSEKIGVTITDESEIGEITVLNADDIFLSLDQNVHQLSEPLQVRFTPVDELVSDVAPDVSSFEFSYHLEFENEDSTFETSKILFKQVKVSKDNFEKMLGQDGAIQIINENNEVIATLNKNSKVNNNAYVVDIDTNNICIKTSKPQTEGILSIQTEKEIINFNGFPLVISLIISQYTAPRFNNL